MTAEEWIDRFAALIGEEPLSATTRAELLELAATAAHASERIAAPIACYLAGRTGRPVAELAELATSVH
ncbi:MAG: hypothetical protein H0U42_07200 [Thermoleophilaceae bacterium]|nr:hypothetical protein [Thermoleophilaceae bacterium]